MLLTGSVSFASDHVAETRIILCIKIDTNGRIRFQHFVKRSSRRRQVASGNTDFAGRMVSCRQA